MTLKVKTLGDANPNGMPKVYYCCHAEDFSPYFPRISKEILNISNCAIYWYEGDPGEEWELELGQMQLFVMPVTRLLLTTANRALDVEFRFALERHIPLLQSTDEVMLQENCPGIPSKVDFQINQRMPAVEWDSRQLIYWFSMVERNSTSVIEPR